MKTISGTWFEFKHHNIPEGAPWNPICRKFSEAQWRAKVREIHDIGMEYIVLMHTALVYEDSCEAYFDTDIYPFPADMVCKDPIGALLDEADKLDMKVFLSVGFYGVWTNTIDNMRNPEVTQRAFRAMEQLTEKYGHHKSFFGWYYPDEVGIEAETTYVEAWDLQVHQGRFPELLLDYCHTYSEKVRQLDPTKKTLIAPYGIKYLIPDEVFEDQIRRIDVDIIAYQDKVGCRQSDPETNARNFKALRQIHDRLGRVELWTDMEIFRFEGEVYKSALLPSDMERMERQLEALSPWVDQVLCYQYLGIMNQPSTIAFCGHPDSIAYYEAYDAFRKKHK